MTRGATIQFTAILKPSCIHIWRCAKARRRILDFTLQRIGYILTRSPTAVKCQGMYWDSLWEAELTNRCRNLHELPTLQRRLHAVDEVSQQNSHDYYKQDPEYQQTVKPSRTRIDGPRSLWWFLAYLLFLIAHVNFLNERCRLVRSHIGVGHFVDSHINWKRRSEHLSGSRKLLVVVGGGVCLVTSSKRAMKVYRSHVDICTSLPSKPSSGPYKGFHEASLVGCQSWLEVVSLWMIKERGEWR